MDYVPVSSGSPWQAFYDVVFHPLAGVPGPFTWKISNQPLTVSIMRGNRAQTLMALHRQYGPVLRVGPNEVSFADPGVYRQIYSTRATAKDDRFYSNGRFRNHDNIFSMRQEWRLSKNKAEHSARRKILNLVFSQQKLLENQDFVVERSRALVRRISEASQINGRYGTPTAAIFELLGLFSVEVICKFTFGFEFEDDTMKAGLAFLRGMENSAARLPLNANFPFLDSCGIGKRLPGAIGAAYRGFEVWENMNRELLVEFQRRSRDEAKAQGQNLFAIPLLDATDQYQGRQLTTSEVEEEIMGITFAGSGTTSNTLAFLIYALSRPEGQCYQDELRKELLANGGDYFTIKDLPYLKAVIKETLRLFPTIVSTLPRILDTDQMIAGFNLPKGTVVGMQNYVHHRDPVLFPRPDEFIPDRWLNEDTKNLNDALTPFSLGNRNCIGQNLAMIEICIAVSEVFRSLRLTLNKSMSEDDMEIEDRFAAAPRGRKLLVDVDILSKQM
ncbi:uncharacterized protein Z518_11302 [Rhinocladiella mackenziei CBS 650.93]|uniref:Cytochrome P450 monooxygenase n=1 Tax=Rhinocladiella mackenziei CBS 650.93 TaxID=1442369 RepID=A0A0D2I1H2_9EURO|nr:uncharacterized protein Z518_11302 [Rhinocladiella mackenziei CBS 650.93]KIW99563.1 hypothetical protein Z518_11302 [Rhinocladiella mackenziei CBS 650.93]